MLVAYLHMHIHNSSDGSTALMVIGMLLVGVLLVGTIVLAIRSRDGDRGSTTAAQTLDARLARGDIGVPEYQRLRRAMDAGRPEPCG